MNTNNTKRIIVGTLIVIVILALGIVGGYLLGQMHKNQDVDQAKATAKLETLQQAQSDAKKNTVALQALTPSKTATETTCNADELSLAASASADSGAGTLAYDLVLTNVGKRTCILGGFPGVSLVNDNGNQVGTPAGRAKNYTEKKLTLTPNTKVKAVVSVSNSANFTDGQCKSGATKFRVYPPNDTGYLSMASTVDSWCPGFEISPVLSM
jgi:cytoskeletal protein RodZ